MFRPETPSLKQEVSNKNDALAQSFPKTASEHLQAAKTLFQKKDPSLITNLHRAIYELQQTLSEEPAFGRTLPFD